MTIILIYLMITKLVKLLKALPWQTQFHTRNYTNIETQRNNKQLSWVITVFHWFLTVLGMINSETLFTITCLLSVTNSVKYFLKELFFFLFFFGLNVNVRNNITSDAFSFCGAIGVKHFDILHYKIEWD